MTCQCLPKDLIEFLSFKFTSQFPCQNVTHPMYKMANWCINGCWFIMATFEYRQFVATIPISYTTFFLTSWKLFLSSVHKGK